MALKLSLAELRVETFETTAGAECGECTGCTVYTGCGDCTACTRCTWPTCIRTDPDGNGCEPGTER
ncbi:MAG TPA: hypothetical protein VF710_22930 [Longimicrobium sp.]|jgi:hypothetical protein